MALTQMKAFRAVSARRSGAVRVRATAEPTVQAARVVIKEYGTATLKGTSRKVNEDRFGT